MSDRYILAIPDSTAWRAGVQHERERIIHMAHAIAEQISKGPLSRDCKKNACDTLLLFAEAIRETP